MFVVLFWVSLTNFKLLSQSLILANQHVDKKNEKKDSNHTERLKCRSTKSLHYSADWLVYILVHGLEEWVLRIHFFPIHYFTSILKSLQWFTNKLIHIGEMVYTEISKCHQI